MNFQIFGNEKAQTLLLIPGLGVSYEIFLPLIRLTKDKFRIIAAEVDGFTLGKYTRFTSVDDQAAQVIAYIKAHFDGHLNCAYGLSLGGKILSRVLERNELTIDHAILDAAPLLPLPRWLVNPLRYYQAANVWTCYHWTGFWKAVFRSHYFDVLLDECKKVWPFGGTQAVVDCYKSVYTNRLNAIHGADIHFWYGTKEAFVAKPQVKHLLSLCPQAHIEVFPGMNHGQLLIDRPEEIAQRITKLLIQTSHIHETAYGTTTSALPERILYLCTCVAWAAKGDLEHLETAVPQALDHGVTINELKDAFAQLYAYAGFPRSLNALGVLEKILNAKMVNGTLSLGTWQWGKPFVRPAVWDDAGEALRTGTAIQTHDEGGTPWDYTFCPQADYYMKSHLFGDIYASDQLTPAERELVTVAALSAMDGVTPQFEGHKECAVFMGNTPEQVAELCRWLSHVMNAE